MPIRVQIDDRVRLMSSVLLLTEFANENSSQRRPHPLKVRTMEYLAGCADHPCVEATRKLAHTWGISAFHCYAVLLQETGGPLAVLHSGEGVGYDMSPVLRDFEGMGHADHLCRFRQDTRLPAFWEAEAEEWNQAVEDCARALRESGVEEFLALLFGASMPDVMILVPDPLGPPWSGFGPNDGQRAYCILGPPAAPDAGVSYGDRPEYVVGTALHEFAHTGWAWTRQQYPGLVERTAHLQDTMTPTGHFPEAYPTWALQLDELIVRAATALYRQWRGDAAGAQLLIEKEIREFSITLAARVFDQLSEYLSRRERGQYQGLTEFVPVMVDRLLAQRA